MSEIHASKLTGTVTGNNDQACHRNATADAIAYWGPGDHFVKLTQVRALDRDYLMSGELDAVRFEADYVAYPDTGKATVRPGVKCAHEWDKSDVSYRNDGGPWVQGLTCVYCGFKAKATS